MEWKLKLIGFISKCFKDNAAGDQPSTESGSDSGESGIPPEDSEGSSTALDSDRSTGAGATNHSPFSYFPKFSLYTPGHD